MAWDDSVMSTRETIDASQRNACSGATVEGLSRSGTWDPCFDSNTVFDLTEYACLSDCRDQCVFMGRAWYGTSKNNPRILHADFQGIDPVFQQLMDTEN